MTIKQIQCLLLYLGYYAGEVDGQDGPLTLAAIKEFQRDVGLPVDGDFGPLSNTAALDAVAKGRFKQEEQPKQTTNAPESGKGLYGSKYFTRKEFRCPCGKCGGFPVEPQKELVLAMDDMREAFGSAVIVVPPDGHSGGSGVRCAAYNATLSGSVSNSRHLLGKAADFTAPGVPASTIEAYLTKIKNNGTIRYWYKISAGSYHMDVL